MRDVHLGLSTHLNQGRRSIRLDTAEGSTRKGGASNVRFWRELLEKLAKEQRL